MINVFTEMSYSKNCYSLAIVSLKNIKACIVGLASFAVDDAPVSVYTNSRYWASATPPVIFTCFEEGS